MPREKVAVISSTGWMAHIVEEVIKAKGYVVEHVEPGEAEDIMKGIAMYEGVMFDVGTEEQSKDEDRRHALVKKIQDADPRVKVACVVREEFCKERICRYGCTRFTSGFQSWGRFRSDMEWLFERP